MNDFNPNAVKFKMTKFTVTKTISHPKVPDPISKSEEFEARSLADAVKALNVSGKQACDLKKHRTTSWVDDADRTHTIQLKGGEIILLET